MMFRNCRNNSRTHLRFCVFRVEMALVCYMRYIFSPCRSVCAVRLTTVYWMESYSCSASQSHRARSQWPDSSWRVVFGTSYGIVWRRCYRCATPSRTCRSSTSSTTTSDVTMTRTLRHPTGVCCPCRDC